MTETEARELDAQVAVCLGWRWRRSSAGRTYLAPPDGTYEDEDVTGTEALYPRFHDWDKCPSDAFPRGLPSYSTDLAHVGPLLVWLQAQHADPRLIFDKCWCCWALPAKGAMSTGWCRDESLSLAVCRAVLVACGAEKQNA